jgi:methionine--tRNA ligase beta chain
MRTLIIAILLICAGVCLAFHTPIRFGRKYGLERGVQDADASKAPLRCVPTSADVQEGGEVVTDPVTDLSKMEIRVGKIVEIGLHPDAETLYVEKVDCGEEDGPRTIVSGLVNFCSVDDLLNRQVVVLCNLKPRAMRGITSAGMLLCGSNTDHSKVEPLIVPEGAVNGELIAFVGHAVAPIEPGNKSSKIYSKICDNFKVNAEGEATYDGATFDTSAGPIRSSFLEGTIS